MIACAVHVHSVHDWFKYMDIHTYEYTCVYTCIEDHVTM